MRKGMTGIALILFLLAVIGRTDQTTGTDARSTIGHWRFEEGAPATCAKETLADSSGAGNHGKVSESPTFTSDVPVTEVSQEKVKNRLALVFDGRADRVAFASPFVFNQPGDATLEFWLKHAGKAHQAVFWGRPDNSDANRFHIYVNPDNTLGVDYREPSGKLHPIIGGGGPSGGVPFPPNMWTHIALTRAGNTYRLYVNGALQFTHSDATPKLPTSIGWFISGRRGYDLVGSVDEVRISNVALSPELFLSVGHTADRPQHNTDYGSRPSRPIGE